MAIKTGMLTCGDMCAHKDRNVDVCSAIILAVDWFIRLISDFTLADFEDPSGKSCPEGKTLRVGPISDHFRPF